MLLIAVLGSALALVPSSAHAAFPGANGPIVFFSDRDGNLEIYKMAPDGSAQTRLTTNTAADYYPAVSPDGSKIAFMSERDGNREIYVMAADGTGQTRITTHVAVDENPTWSPDGTKIAFGSNRDGNTEIYRMDANGANPLRLTTNAALDSEPAWSPDGTRIAFRTQRDGPSEIYSMAADGSDQVRLTNSPLRDDNPAWSPNGAKIAFTSYRDGAAAGGEIYSMDANGANPTRLTNDPDLDAEPAWSPDGSQIIFESQRDRVGLSDPSDLYAMTAAGGSVVRRTNNLKIDSSPDWSVPTPVSPLRPTATQVRCDRGPKPWDPSRCTATVGDSGAPVRKTPTGKVTMRAGDGSFPQIYACTLTATPLSPGVASCKIDGVSSGTKGFASVVATYSGSSIHRTSTATTGFIVAGTLSTPEPKCGATTARGPLAGASLNNHYYGVNKEGWIPDFDDAEYCFWGGIYVIAEGTTKVVQGVAYVAPVVAGVAAGATLPIPEPTTKVAGGIAAATLVYVPAKLLGAAGESMDDSVDTAQLDPPDPRFKRLAKVKTIKLRKLPVAAGVSAKQARAIARALREIERSTALGVALTATLDRAGGAELAKNTAWQGKQMRLAVKLAGRYAKQLDRAAKSVAPVRKGLAKHPLFSAKLDSKRSKQLLRRVAKRGFTSKELRALRSMGTSAKEAVALRKQAAAAAKGSPPKRISDLFSNKTVATFRNTAKLFRFYVRVPQVLELARLR